MRDYPEYKKSAIRFWERRRLLYNLLLVPPTVISYTATMSVIYVGDPHETLYALLLTQLALGIVGANICYTFAYVLEFLLGNDDPASSWLQSGRRAAFVAGVVFAMFLALAGGRNIALMEYNAQPRHVD